MEGVGIVKVRRNLHWLVVAERLKVRITVCHIAYCVTKFQRSKVGSNVDLHMRRTQLFVSAHVKSILGFNFT